MFLPIFIPTIKFTTNQSDTPVLGMQEDEYDDLEEGEEVEGDEAKVIPNKVRHFDKISCLTVLWCLFVSDGTIEADC